jgi:hypothetical protein
VSGSVCVSSSGFFGIPLRSVFLSLQMIKYKLPSHSKMHESMPHY